jgi:membrane protease YdiL (CAAX protease family)
MTDAWTTHPRNALPPPAWYPDPSGAAELRYWDGTAWTPGVVIGGQVTERPMPWPPLAGAPQPARAAPTEPKPPDDRPELPGRASLYALGGFATGAVIGLGLGIAAAASGLPDVAVLLVNAIALWTGLLGACWLASRRYGSGHIGRDYGLRFSGADFGWGLLMSLAAKFAGALVLIPFLFGSRRLLGGNEEVYVEVLDGTVGFAVFAVIAVVGAPLVEELFFRGLLLRSLTTAVGTAAAVGLQAVLFGLAHFTPLLGLANLSVMAVVAAGGVVFGITAWWRTIGTSVAAHAFYNVMGVIAAAFVA